MIAGTNLNEGTSFIFHFCYLVPGLSGSARRRPLGYGDNMPLAPRRRPTAAAARLQPVFAYFFMEFAPGDFPRPGCLPIMPLNSGFWLGLCPLQVSNWYLQTQSSTFFFPTSISSTISSQAVCSNFHVVSLLGSLCRCWKFYLSNSISIVGPQYISGTKRVPQLQRDNVTTITDDFRRSFTGPLNA